MPQDDKFEFESMQDAQTIQGYLQALQDGFERGRIVLNYDNSEICVNPQGFMKFAVSVKKKGLENKLVIKVSWKDSQECASSPGTISISS